MSEPHTLDLRGMKCPTPIVRLNEAVRGMSEGDSLVALADDRAFELDVKAWCRRTGHELLSLAIDAGQLTAHVRKHAA